MDEGKGTMENGARSGVNYGLNFFHEDRRLPIEVDTNGKEMGKENVELNEMILWY